MNRDDAQPILEALRNARYNPRLVGSIAIKGRSDNDIDIVLPVKLERDMSLGITHGLINRDSLPLKAYYQVMNRLGFECIIAPPFSKNDTWHRGDILIDIWFI